MEENYFEIKVDNEVFTTVDRIEKVFEVNYTEITIAEINSLIDLCKENEWESWLVFWENKKALLN